MSFLNWALLGGALALAVPVLIHLFHRSRFEVVRWGAMHLLEAVMRTNQRRLRMEQWILLAVRCAIPVLLALAMARPLWRGAQPLLGQGTASTILLLDNSYSMAAGRAGQSNFAAAREEAVRMLGGLKRGSEASAVLLGGTPEALLPEPTYDPARLASAMGPLEAGSGAADVPGGMELAGRILGRMHEAAREVVVLTDFQRASFDAAGGPLLGQMIARLKAQPVPPQITFFDLGAGPVDNVAVESLEVPRLAVGVGQRVQVRAGLRNFGGTDYPDLRVHFKVDGQERGASQVRLGPGERTQVLFHCAFEKAGSHFVEVVAEADALEADNRFLASVLVRDRLPVLLVNGEPSSEPMRGETDFAELALQPFRPKAGEELAGLIAARVIAPADLNAKALSGQLVVVLANVARLSDEQLRALEAFVRAGGGLMVFPGSRCEAPWYDGPFFAGGNGLLPRRLGRLSGEAKEGAPSVAILSRRSENPALELFNDPRNGRLSDSAVRAWHRFEPAEGPGAAVETLAELENGDAFLVEHAFGSGRVIACATALDADWSNLPMRPFYVPLLQRLAVYLASTVEPPRNLETGRPLSAFFPPESAGKQAWLTLPDGGAVGVPVLNKAGRGVVEFSRTGSPGLYTLAGPDGSVAHYAYNAPRRESDLERLSAKEVEAFARENGVGLVHSAAEYEDMERARRFGRELWRPLLWVLLGVVFLEMILEQVFARGRLRP